MTGLNRQADLCLRAEHMIRELDKMNNYDANLHVINLKVGLIFLSSRASDEFLQTFENAVILAEAFFYENK